MKTAMLNNYNFRYSLKTENFDLKIIFDTDWYIYLSKTERGDIILNCIILAFIEILSKTFKNRQCV